MSAPRLPRRRMLLVDTSVLLEVLRVPFESDRSAEVTEEFDDHLRKGVALQIPMASVLETGSHIRRIRNGDARRRCARTFTLFLEQALIEQPPWRFSPFAWNESVIRNLLDGEGHGYSLIRSIGDGIFEIGDLTIIEEWRIIFHNVSPKVYDIDVWTLDSTLRGIIDGLRAQRFSSPPSTG